MHDIVSSCAMLMFLASLMHVFNTLKHGQLWTILTHFTPRFNGVERGYTGITLSVCPSVDRIMSALYLQQYSSDPFHICTSYQATSEGVSRVMPVSKFKNVKFWRIFQICNFDFGFFWLGIQYDSMVWVIIRRRGVSSERRHSSCSSWGLGKIWAVLKHIYFKIHFGVQKYTMYHGVPRYVSQDKYPEKENWIKIIITTLWYTGESILHKPL